MAGAAGRRCRLRSARHLGLRRCSLPGTGAQLELTAGGGRAVASPDPDLLVVLYLGSPEAVRVRAAGLKARPVRAANPYWDERGLTFEDPDGFRVVLVAGSWS